MKVLEIVLQFIGSACSCCNAYHVCHLDSSSLPVLGFFPFGFLSSCDEDGPTYFQSLICTFNILSKLDLYFYGVFL